MPGQADQARNFMTAEVVCLRFLLKAVKAVCHTVAAVAFTFFD
jgi:hypothetical protein